LTADERKRIRSLAQDLPALWQTATTTPADRQRIVRFLLEKVTVSVQGQSERVEVVLHWCGGCTSRHELVRPVKRYEQLAEHPLLLSRIEALRGQGRSWPEVAHQLNREGFHPPKRVAAFTADILGKLWSRQKLQRRGAQGIPMWGKKGSG
jgi:hypothetical protein